jgi:photosystem I subunit 9
LGAKPTTEGLWPPLWRWKQFWRRANQSQGGKVFELFLNLKQIKKICMKNFTTYLSTAPVVALVWFTITAALLIEINRFFPDPLVFSF